MMNGETSAIQPTENRRFTRHAVNIDGRLIIDNHTSRCTLIDISSIGAKIFTNEESCLKNNQSGCLDCGHEKVQFSIKWHGSPFLGVKFDNPLPKIPINTKPKRWPGRFLAWLSSDAGRALELAVLIFTAGYVAKQTSSIKDQTILIADQNIVQAKELRLQSIIQIEDSERFINRLLIENPKIAKLLYATEIELNNDDSISFQKSLLAYVFLQEWEKMFRLNQSLNDSEMNAYWDDYKPVILKMKKIPLFKDLLADPEKNLIGMNKGFVKWITK